MIRAYLDNNATTRTSEEVIAAMLPYFRELYANPSSAAGQVIGADRIVAEAKRAAALLLGSADLATEIVLTSGASESNSWAFHAPMLKAGDQIVVSAIEHPSILSACAAAEAYGVRVALVGCDENGSISESAFRAAVGSDTRLICVMLANNETGVIQPVERLSAIARERAPSSLIHCDVTQALGRIPVDLSEALAEVDLASFSAHKFHGPKGIGGMFIRSGTNIRPILYGEQEKGLRGGTINSPGAAGLARACEMARVGLSSMANVKALRDDLEEQLLERISGVSVNGRRAPRLPNTSSLTIRGLDAAEAVDELARRGICVANGSACTAGSDAPSHVLIAMGVSYEDAFQTIRVSLSRDTSADDVALLVTELVDLAK